MKLSDRHLRLGRLAIYVEWRDLWIACIDYRIIGFAHKGST